MDRVLVMAEPGSTHGGDLDRMKRMIQVASECGADAIKFQWCSDPHQLCERRHVESPEVYRTISFPAEWHVQLHAACERDEIEYACTTYLLQDIPIVALFVQRFKVASFEALDRKFIKAHQSYNRPILVSTGMCSPAELYWLFRRERKNPNIQLLHCISAYPAPLEELNLAVIRRYGFAGFSDHSGLTETGGLAVAAGARIVEIHFRLDDTDSLNPDYPHSLLPGQLREYIANIRFAEAAMGDGEKRTMPSEESMTHYRVRTGDAGH